MDLQVVYRQCRICLQFQPEYKNVFNTLVNEIPISKMIFECASVEVPENDNVVHVCDNCTMKLATAYQLRLQMITSDLYLRNLNEMKIEPEENNECENKGEIQIVDLTTNQSIDNEAIKEEPGLIEEMTIEKSNEERYSPVCKESFKNAQHPVEEHSEIIPYTCTICNKNFFSCWELNSHIQVHRTVKPRACQICGKPYTSCSALIRHEKKHSRINSIKCDICNKDFGNKRSMMKHKKCHNSIKCDICNKDFVDKRSVEQHKRCHNSKMKYVCEVCGKGFFSKHDHRTHMGSHNKKSFPCTACGKLFKDPTAVEMHKTSHCAVHACRICKNKFVNSSLLKSHMRIHNYNKSYSDEVWGKHFTQGTPNLHRRTHTLETPYECSSSQTFNYTQDMQRRVQFRD